MKKLLLILLCMMANAAPAKDISEKPVQVHHMHIDVDDLLHEAFHDGVHEEIMKPKELRWYDQWIRTLGGALFIKCVAIQHYVKKIVAFEK